MGLKSRANFRNEWCFKKCANRDIKCDQCVSIQGKPTAYAKPNNERIKNKSCFLDEK
jgi:hypothetical protein